MFFAFVVYCAAAAAPAPAQPSARAVPLDPRTAAYELRTYYPAPGKLPALNARFRNHTTKLFERHGMRNIAYWTASPSADAPDGKLIYVLAHRSRETASASWKAFGADPEWRAVHARSEAQGKLVARIESLFMDLTDYSPPVVLPRLKR